jgi:hypothetical protein
MCIGSHAVSATIVAAVAIAFGASIADTPSAGLWLMFGALAPDFFDIFIWVGNRVQNGSHSDSGLSYRERADKVYRRMEKTWWCVPVHIAQSHVTAILLWIIVWLGGIPIEFVIGYHLHIFIDQWSHTRHWALYPLSRQNFAQSRQNWYDWTLYQGRGFTPIVLSLCVVSAAGYAFLYL